MKKIFLSTAFWACSLAMPLWAQHRSIFELMNDESANFYEVQKQASKYFDSVGTGKGSGYKQFKRWEYKTSLLINEKGFRKSSAEIMKECRRAEANFRSKNARTAAVTHWTELGPDKMTPTSGWNPGVGRVRSIAISTKNASLIFAGTESGGAWKSTNGGKSWTATMVKETNQNISALTIDPQNDQIVYAGCESGYYKSVDGGNTWVLNTSVTSTFNKFIIHPTNSNIIIAATKGGTYKSNDAGATWTKSHASAVEDLEFKPNNPQIIYAIGDGVYLKSTDGGNSFTAIASITGRGRSMVSVTTANPEVVYVIQATPSGIFGKFYKSIDSGDNFTIVSSGFSGNNNILGYEPNGTGTTGQAWHDLAMDVSPTNENLVHVGGIICFKSIDGGITWNATTNWTWGNTIGYNHADVHVLTYNGSTLYSGSDGGIFKSTDNAENWTDITTGMGIRQFYRFGICKSNPEVISGGAQDNGTSVRRSDGIWYDWLGGDGMESFVDHQNPSILYGTSQGGDLYKSTDGGNTRVTLTNPSWGSGNWITPFRMDPNASSTIYVGYSKIYKSTNGGTTWDAISNYGASSRCDEIEIAPSNSNFIITRHGQKIYKTNNGGTTWTPVTIPTNIGNVNSVAIHQSDPEYVVIGTSTGNVYQSVDFADNFTQISGANLPAIAINKIVFDNGSLNGFYVGTVSGVFYKDSSLTDYLPFNENLPTQSISDMEFHNATKRLYVATYGRGVWWAQAYKSGSVNNIPQVTITNPINNAVFTDPNAITINANASDSDGQVVKVDFFVDGTLLGTDSIAPYDIVWNNNLLIGKHTMYAKARDNSGTFAISSEVNITINSALNQNPVIKITNPLLNALLDEPLTTLFAVETSDPDGTIAEVSYYLNGNLVTSLNTGFNYNANNLQPGIYVLKAIAKDNMGAKTADSVTFVVRKSVQGAGCTVAAWVSSKQYCAGQEAAFSNKLWKAKWCISGEVPGSNKYGAWEEAGACLSTVYSQLPTVTITNPLQAAQFNAPADITINASANDADGTVSKVEFYANGQLLTTDFMSPFTFDWKSVQTGEYKLIAKVYDNYNLEGVSSEITINVNTIAAIYDALQGNESFAYPIPTKDILYIRSPEMLDKEYDLSIVSLEGKLMYHKKVNLLNTFGLDIRFLQQGNYLLSIENGVNKKVIQFVVKP
ncbi:MAG: hypothetical protein RLZZ175_913 [Bacteroidota bacterium]|jgi:photosystem II stability/assembly factor-like uncharacterized protein